jgi:hypothetical protein
LSSSPAFGILNRQCHTLYLLSKDSIYSLIQVQGFMGRIVKRNQGLDKEKVKISGTPVRFMGKGMRYTGDKVSFVGPYYELFGEETRHILPGPVYNSRSSFLRSEQLDECE